MIRHLTAILIFGATPHACLASTPFGGNEDETKLESPSAPALFERPVVLGASLSDGFLLNVELGANADLADALACVLPAAPEPPPCECSTWLFLNPKGQGPELLRAALEREPTVVFALDFLFWFGYGSGLAESSRPALLERGLALLDELPCPVVVGDFPDMSPALEGTSLIGPMLTPDMVPSPGTLAKLNERLLDWAEKRERGAAVVPLSGFLDRLRAGEPVEVRGNVWEEGDLEEILQEDLLHPTARGTLAVAILAADALLRSYPEVSDEGLTWDEEALEDRLAERLAAER